MTSIIICRHSTDLCLPKTGDINFPVVFQLCMAELKSKGDKYQRFGYKDEEHMYLGQSLYNKSVFGWAGHRNNGSHFSVAGKVIKINLTLFNFTL